MADATCSVDGCDTRRHIRSLCRKHYQQWLTTDGPLQVKLRGTPAERFWPRVHKTETCWEWTAGGSNGYGQFWDGQRVVWAHRWSYINTVGPLSEDRPHIDHLCRNRACVRPDHLEPVTAAENNHRTRLDGCRRGHPYPENEYRSPRGRRWCLKCRRERDATNPRVELPRVNCVNCGRLVGLNPRITIPTPVGHKASNGQWCRATAAA